MRQAVLLSGIERKRVTKIKAHGLAAAGDRNMQRAVVVGSESTQQRGDDVGCCRIFFRCTNIGQLNAFGITHDMQMTVVEYRVSGFGIVAQKCAELAAIGMQERRSREKRALRGGHEMDLGRYECRSVAHRERVKGLRQYLRAQAAGSEQDAAFELMGCA